MNKEQLQSIVDNAPDGATHHSDSEHLYIKWQNPQTGIFFEHDSKYGNLVWCERFNEWDYLSSYDCAKLVTSVRSLSDIKTILSQQTALEESERWRYESIQAWSDNLDKAQARVRELEQAINGKLYDFTPRHTVINELLELARPFKPPESE